MSDIPTIPEMDETARKAWPLFSEKFSLGTPEEFYSRMTKGLPRGTKLDLNLGEQGDLQFIGYRYKDEKGKFFFERTITEDVAYHAITVLDPALQGSGIAKTANGNLFRLYQEMDIKHIALDASDIGSYAWARAGFVPTHKDWSNMRQEISNRLDFLQQHVPPHEKPLPDGCVEALRKALSSDDSKSFWSVVDEKHSYCGTSLGKLLTLPANQLPGHNPWPEGLLRNGTHWHGILNMNDPVSVQRMEAYLFAQKSGPSPKAKPAAQTLSAAGARR